MGATIGPSHFTLCFSCLLTLFTIAGNSTIVNPSLNVGVPFHFMLIFLTLSSKAADVVTLFPHMNPLCYAPADDSSIWHW